MLQVEIVLFLCFVISTALAHHWREKALRTVRVNSSFGYGKISLRDKHPHFILDVEGKKIQ